jgi:hypothetical protein
MRDDDDRMTTDRECGGDVAAYVLSALEPEEAEAFRRHMAACAICHDEVAALAAVAQTLPMAAPRLKPPRALRRRVMRAVRADAAAAVRRRRVPRARPALASAVAVVAAAAAVVGGIELSSGGSATRVIQAQVIGSAGSARLRLKDGTAELVVSHFPPPPPGRIYEVWLQRPGRLSPANVLFDVTRAGTGDVAVPGDMHGVSALLVTPEPDGGSRAPTHTPVIVARLV